MLRIASAPYNPENLSANKPSSQDVIKPTKNKSITSMSVEEITTLVQKFKNEYPNKCINDFYKKNEFHPEAFTRRCKALKIDKDELLGDLKYRSLKTRFKAPIANTVPSSIINDSFMGMPEKKFFAKIREYFLKSWLNSTTPSLTGLAGFFNYHQTSLARKLRNHKIQGWGELFSPKGFQLLKLPEVFLQIYKMQEAHDYAEQQLAKLAADQTSPMTELSVPIEQPEKQIQDDVQTTTTTATKVSSIHTLLNHDQDEEHHITSNNSNSNISNITTSTQSSQVDQIMEVLDKEFGYSSGKLDEEFNPSRKRKREERQNSEKNNNLSHFSFFSQERNHPQNQSIYPMSKKPKSNRSS